MSITITSTLKFTNQNLSKSVSGGCQINWDGENFNIQTEYPNIYRGEGYATVWIQVNGKGYQRTFPDEVPDIRIINFINKFINDKPYRDQWSNSQTSKN